MSVSLKHLDGKLSFVELFGVEKLHLKKHEQVDNLLELSGETSSCLGDFGTHVTMFITDSEARSLRDQLTDILTI